MIHKWMEDLFDTWLYFCIILGLLIFSVFYWKDAYQIRCAEVILEEFLVKTSTSGKISLEEFEGILERVNRLNPEYDVEMTGMNYVLSPGYALIPQSVLDQYYMGRNKRKDTVFREFEAEIKEEDVETLRFQTETNASIMAAEKENYLPLPGEGTNLQVEAVRNLQEVYEGEELITLCRVTSETGCYYVEAQPVFAVSSGTVSLEVMVEAELRHVLVDIICHPRTVLCQEGHVIVNSKEIIEEKKQSGKIKCPYCEVLPRTVKSNSSLITKKTGGDLEKQDVWLEVTFLDGHMEIITPADNEWQDNYDKNYCGVQPVTLMYRGKTDTITVISENEACKQCGEHCNERCYLDYLGFPYCTRCMAEVLLFTGEVYEEECVVSFEEMAALLDKEEIMFKSGDLISLRLLKNGNLKTILQRTIVRDGKRR